MKFETKYRLILWKSYFDQGYSLTNYVKFPLGFFALSSRNVELTLYFVAIYSILCFFLGYFWFKYGWVKVQQEVSNKYNLFVEEMRENLKKPKRLKR